HKNSSTPDTPPRARPAPPQETLVHDARAGLTPAQMVERKLVALLGNSILPASHLQASRMRRTLS
ncbi:MAG: hypothetical protein ACRELF_15545, partial [Gemmataceae bacterium]